MITTLGLALGVLFLLVPLCVAYVYHINMVASMLRAFCCMTLRVGVLGVAVYHHRFLHQACFRFANR